MNALIVAAGGGRRMGGPKGLLRLGDRPLIAWHLDALRAACTDITVVLGCRADEHLASCPPPTRRVLHPAWQATQMIDSVVLGLRATPCGEAVLVLPVDVPPPQPGTLAALAACAGDAVPAHHGRDGHPVRLSAATVAAILARPDPRGLREHLRAARRVPVEDPDATLDFDDPAAWAAWRDRARP